MIDKPMLTRESILALKPCRRTNWLIHMVVMGNKAWKYKRREGERYVTHIRFSPEKPTWPDEIYIEIPFEDVEEGRILVQDVPDYSGDISAAWKVLEKFHEVSVKRFETMKGHRYWCKIELDYNGDNEIAQGEKAPEAICKAALLTTIREDKQ